MCNCIIQFIEFVLLEIDFCVWPSLNLKSQMHKKKNLRAYFLKSAKIISQNNLSSCFIWVAETCDKRAYRNKIFEVVVQSERSIVARLPHRYVPVRITLQHSDSSTVDGDTTTNNNNIPSDDDDDDKNHH